MGRVTLLAGISLVLYAKGRPSPRCAAVRTQSRARWGRRRVLQRGDRAVLSSRAAAAESRARVIEAVWSLLETPRDDLDDAAIARALAGLLGEGSIDPPASVFLRDG